MIDKKILIEVANIFYEEYSDNFLENGILPFVQEFVKKNPSICSKAGITNKQIGQAFSKRLSETEIPKFVAIPFSSKLLFSTFLDFLPKETKYLFDQLIWEDHIEGEILEKENIEIGVKQIINKGLANEQEILQIKPEFTFFTILRNRWFLGNASLMVKLPKRLRRILSDYYDKPEASILKPLAKPPETAFIFCGERSILLDYPRLEIYAQQNKFKTTKRGRPQATGLKSMVKNLGIVEFYPKSTDKLLQTLKSYLLASLMIYSSDTNHNKKSEPHERLRYLFEEMFIEEYVAMITILGRYIKGVDHIERFSMNNTEVEFYDLFAKLPPNEWISIDNFYKHATFNFFKLDPFNRIFVIQNRQLSLQVTDKNGKRKRKEITENNYDDYILFPFLRGHCFLFAAFGLVDIAYEVIDTSTIGDSTYSPFDGISHIRLNNLGAYVLGKTEAYEPPVSAKQQEVVLSRNSLTITINKEDTVSPVILAPFVTPVSPQRFSTNDQVFLKGVHNWEELNDKIVSFKQAVGVALPPNWNAFFKSLRLKVNPFELYRGAKVYSIPSENKELLQLIAKDKVLKEICIKAEGYRFIIKNKDITRFTSRLRDFGYLINNMK